MEKLRMMEYFGDVEKTREHNGYSYGVGRALTIVILGSLCGLGTVKRIHQWATNPKIKHFLAENFAIYSIPCYSWLTTLLGIINHESLNLKFTRWVTTLLPEVLDNLTISFDGKTVCSTGRMSNYDRPLHILSAYLVELGLTVGQKTVSDKSNEIPAMRELLELVNIHGCVVVADALHCQTETAKAIIRGGGDYLLNVKGNQEELEQDIMDFVQDDELRAEMLSATTKELNGGRIEIRRSFVSTDVSWMEAHLPKWEKLSCFGAINRRFTIKGETTNEWHYYIGSRKLTPEELLMYARNEWGIESMHWLLDVHLGEDSCRVRDSNTNQILNIVRKIALNYIRDYKNETDSKQPFSELMFDCLLDSEMILKVLNW